MHPTTARKKSLRIIDIANADKINKLVVKDIKPGQKLCPKCSSHLGSIDECCIEEDEAISLKSRTSDIILPPHLAPLVAIHAVKTKFAQRDRAVYAKRKAQEAQTAIIIIIIIVIIIIIIIIFVFTLIILSTIL